MPRLKTTPKKTTNSFVLAPSNEPRKKKSRKSSNISSTTSGISLQVLCTSVNYPYKLGSIFIHLQESVEILDSFTIQFEPGTSTCHLFLKENHGNNEIKERMLPAVCATGYKILESLCSLKIFNFVLSSNNLYVGNNSIEIYIDPSTFISLDTASQRYLNHHRRKIFDLLHFFLKINFEEYEDNYLFEEEQVENIYATVSNGFRPTLTDVSVSHDSLIPNLRIYQSQAVQWMLKREHAEDVCEAELHELYTVLTMQDGQKLYFHKFGGFFVDRKFPPEKPCSGGILADEMGLGKTLEVLACILLNPRKYCEKQNKVKSECITNGSATNSKKILNGSKRRKLSLSDNSDTEEYSDYEEKSEYSDYEEESEDDEYFECFCGLERSSLSSKPTVSCVKCGVTQHAKCIFYKPDLLRKNSYTCPYCWINKSELESSRATLIISPTSIIYQWEQEIYRHIKKNHLKVFMYQGVEFQKFVDPSFLADHDVVLVSYETLKKELNHVDVPHGENGLSLRRRKRFLAIPSPLCAVQWWRICLDEAQMVESVSSKTAVMTGKLHSIHRWCVSGTPVKKSIEDLYGLLVFLDMKPYHEKLWWKEALWKPFVNGNNAPLSSVLKQMFWRTTKQQVLDQIGLPALQEITHKLEFSPIEMVFYKNQYSFCKRDFIEKINKFDSLDIKLSSMDKHALSKVLLPLRRLQLVCCHFQINHGSVDVHKKKMTTKELLAHLLKTTKYECEDAHRKLIMAMSGAAGIYFIRNEIQTAIETYEKTLKSIEDNKSHFRTDKTQQIHSLYQLSNILTKCEKEGKPVESIFNLSELNAKIEELSIEYVEKYRLTVEVCSENIHAVAKEIDDINNNFKLKHKEFDTSAWWACVFESVPEDQRQSFLSKIEDVLKNAQGKGILKNESVLSKSISGINFFGFLSLLYDVSKDLHNTRKVLKEKIESISAEPSVSSMNSAISCHLRPEKKSAKCQYCEADVIFQRYQTKLFRFDEATKDISKEEGEEEEEEEKEEVKPENICFQAGVRGSRADSDFELVLKFLLNYSRRRKDLPEGVVEAGKNELKLLGALKKEFQVLRNLWIKCVDYVQQKDEVEMAKISARLLLPGEPVPNPPVPYIILPHEVQSKLVQYHSDIIAYQFELKKKMGQLFYLQNLEKAENKDAPFQECCPVCQLTFEKSWNVLQCGHSFCLFCVQRLLDTKTRFTNNLGFVCQGICCPVCRQYTVAADVYFIDNNNENEQAEEISIKGSYSTKTTAVVKCLLEINKKDPTAKSLVFSSFTGFLQILEYALEANGVKCLNFYQKKHFQNNLETFKVSEECNVLLIPLTFGCSGLNITEATNVLLLEPVLDNSKHLQAIGRIHRIGQTKQATVHRFIISQTIEENIFDAMANFSPKENSSELTLQNLADIFANC